MNKIAFNIEQWHALSPGRETLSDWQHKEMNQILPDETPAVSPHLIPAMMRRRMSPLSKIALQTAIYLQQSQDTQFDYS